MPTLHVMHLCRCVDCGIQQSKDLSATGEPSCSHCGGDVAVDKKYHPDFPGALDFGEAPLPYKPDPRLDAKPKAQSTTVPTLSVVKSTG